MKQSTRYDYVYELNDHIDVNCKNFNPDNIEFIEGYPVEKLFVNLNWMILNNRPKDVEKIKKIREVIHSKANYTDKERKIVDQCLTGPYYTLVTEMTNEELDTLVDKIISTGDNNILITLITIYWDYPREKLFDYFIKNGEVDYLVNFLDAWNDFGTADTGLEQENVIDKLLETNNKQLIQDLLNSNSLYFLTKEEQKNRLIEFVS